MTDKERFLSELKLLCNKYAVTLGKSKHYRSVCGEQVLLRTSPAFISKEFERDSILLDLIDDLLLENEYGKVDTLLWWSRESTDLQLLAHLVGFTHAAAAHLPSHQLVKDRYEALVLEMTEPVLLPAVYQTVLCNTIREMGGDAIMTGRSGQLAFIAMLDKQNIEGHLTGDFIRVECTHRPTRERLMQIIRMIVAYGGLDVGPNRRERHD